MALTTLSAVKTFLGISDTSEDDKLTAMVASADAAIKQYCGRQLESATRTEYYSGDGSSVLLLRQRPVTSVTSVHVDASGYAGQGTDAFGSSTAWTAGTDFFVRFTDESERNTGELVAIKGPGAFTADGNPKTWGEWPNGVGNIKVVYLGGYTTVPDDLKLAANQIVAQLRNTAEVGRDLSGEKLGGYSYTIESSGLPGIASARQILNKYRDLVAML